MALTVCRVENSVTDATCTVLSYILALFTEYAELKVTELVTLRLQP